MTDHFGEPPVRQGQVFILGGDHEAQYRALEDATPNHENGSSEGPAFRARAVRIGNHSPDGTMPDGQELTTYFNLDEIEVLGW